MTSVVDISDVLLHALNDNAHRALAGLLTGSDVNIVRVHELVDSLAVNIDFRVVEDESDRKIALRIENKENKSWIREIFFAL